MHRDFRKPLIVMTPKSLLRHKLCVSNLSEMGPKTTFHRVILDPNTELQNRRIKRIVICSGKIFYNLYEEREKRKLEHIKLLRIEQIYPFPVTTLKHELEKTPNAEIVWCQEEPKNMGAWFFVDRKIEETLSQFESKYKRPIYVGRKEAASPATGSFSRHNEEQEMIVKKSLGIKVSKKHAAE